MFREGSYLPRVLAAFSLVFQAVLSNSWLWVYENRFNHSIWERVHAECLWAYNSIYPGLVKTHLPYWQPFPEIWHEPANLSALILATGAITSGWFWQGRKRRAVQCLAGAALLAIILPLAAATQSAPVVWQGDDIRGYTGSSDGKRQAAEEGRDAPGLLAKTPDLFLAPGEYRVSVDYQADGDAGCIGAVMFHNHASATPLSPMMSAGGQVGHDVSSFCVSEIESKKPSCVAVWYSGRGKIVSGK